MAEGCARVGRSVSPTLLPTVSEYGEWAIIIPAGLLILDVVPVILWVPRMNVGQESEQ